MVCESSAYKVDLSHGNISSSLMTTWCCVFNQVCMMLLPGWLGVLQGDLIIPAHADGRLCAESAGALKSDQGRHWPDICLSWNINRRIMSRTPAGSSHNLMKSVSVMWICNEKQTALSARNQRSSNIRLRLIRTTQHTLRTKSISKHSFLVLQLSQIGDSCQYLEGRISTWEDHNRNIGVQQGSTLLKL